MTRQDIKFRLWMIYQSYIRPYTFAAFYEHYKEEVFVAQFTVGSFVEDCRYHPCVILSIDEAHNISVKSLLDKSYNDCYLYDCSVKLLTEDAVNHRINFYEEQGPAAYFEAYAKESYFDDEIKI